MDKQELRQDPIREKIILFLSNLENNRSAIAGFFLLAILSITFATYYSSNAERKDKAAENTLGKAINIKIDGDVDTSNLLFSELLESGTSSTKSVSLIHLIDYYLSKPDTDIFSVDSLIKLNVGVSDDILKSRICLLQGDMDLNLEEYDLAIDNYKNALALDTYMSDEINLRLARTYYMKGSLTKAEEIISSLLEKDDLNYNLKNKCNKMNSMISNYVE